jgi:hypothetical protein
MPLPYLYWVLARVQRRQYGRTVATAIEDPKHLGIFLLHTERRRLISYISRLY